MRRSTLPMLATILILIGAGTAFGQADVVGGVSSGGGRSGSESQVSGYVTGGPGGVSAATSRVHGGLGGLLRSSAAIVPFAAPGPAPAGQDAPIAFQALTEPGAVVTLHYRLGGEGAADYRSVPVAGTGGGDYFVDIPAQDVGVRGLEFYVTAEQSGVMSSFPQADPQGNPLEYRVELSNETLPTLPDAQYRMVGFSFDVNPATVAAVFEDDLGAPDVRKWRLARWAGGTTPGYLHYDEVGNVERGRGYWLARRGSAPVDASGLSAVPTDDVGGADYTLIVLAPGWNQIANPHAFPVNWNDRYEPLPDDIGDVAFGFTGTSYTSVTTLGAHVGVWVENTATVSRELYLPYRQAGSKVAPVAERKSPADLDDWSLRLEIAAGDHREQLLVVGARDGAEERRDHLDAGTPPDPLDEFVSLASLVPGDAGDHRLAADYREPGRQGWHFRLLARGNVRGTASLQALDPESLPADFALAVYDPASDRRFAWDPATGFTLPRQPGPGGDQYILMVGQKAWVEAQDGTPSVMPTVHDLHQNYPNPFNPQTVIAFDLPQPGHVKLEVYDTAGRRVAVLRNEALPGGAHQVTWAGRDHRGSQVASGVYLYRLQTGSYVKTRRMLLLK